MVKTATTLFLLLALAFMATVCLAKLRCPNRCVRPRKIAVRQCRKGARRALCTVKRCSKRRGWRCARKPRRPAPSPSPKAVACTPVHTRVNAICAQGPIGCSPTTEGTEKNFEIGCKCDFGSSFSSEANVITDGLNNDDVRCVLDCIKEKSCLGGACTREVPADGESVVDVCSRKTEISHRNVMKTENKRACCEMCGGSLVFRDRRPSVGDDFVCVAP